MKSFLHAHEILLFIKFNENYLKKIKKINDFLFCFGKPNKAIVLACVWFHSDEN